MKKINISDPAGPSASAYGKAAMYSSAPLTMETNKNNISGGTRRNPVEPGGIRRNPAEPGGPR
eukprot:6498260-Alexandrium_andersonii.AAC.1